MVALGGGTEGTTGHMVQELLSLLVVMATWAAPLQLKWRPGPVAFACCSWCEGLDRWRLPVGLGRHGAGISKHVALLM